MKQNVDLTLNRDFSTPSFLVKGLSFGSMFRHTQETFKWITDGVKKECLNYDNPISKKDADDFIKGLSIVNTGSRDVRACKFNARGYEINEICYECNKPIRIPWSGCSCYRKYLESHGGNKESCRKQLNYPTIIK